MITRPVRNKHFKLVIIWLAIFALAIFAYALRSSNDPVTLSILPEVPRKGDPIAITFNLNNASFSTNPVSYDFFINGERVKSGTVQLPPFSTRKFTYVYLNTLDMGQQAHFAVLSSSPQADYEETVSLPAYPPQVWSSFVSFASFSTSVMSSMSSMVYYKDSFLEEPGVKAGLIFSLVLILLLIFREVTGAVLNKKSLLVPLRLRFRTVMLILLIIFAGMIFSRVVMVFSI